MKGIEVAMMVTALSAPDQMSRSVVVTAAGQHGPIAGDNRNCGERAYK